MAVPSQASQARPAIQPLDILLWVILALLSVPLLLALQAVPWALTLPTWLIPITLLGGVVLGTLITRLSDGRWWAALLAVPGLAIAVGLGAFVVARNATVTPTSLTGALVLGGYVAGLGALVPWLLYRARQAWLVVVLLWLTLAGAWGGQTFTTQHLWETVWLLALSLGLLGLWRLREETQLWRTQHLEQIGPVLWPSARTIVTISIVVALIGLAPLGIAKFGALSRFWNQTPLGQGGPLTYDNPAGAPVAVLGAPLTLDAPDVSGKQTILTYTVTQGPVTTPPLLGATLDTFDGQTWTQGTGITTPAIAQHLTAPPKAQTLTTQVTVGTLPATENGSFLLGFDQPLGFSVPTRAQTIGADAPTALTIAGWETTKPLVKGATYSVTSAIIAADGAATATGTLPAALTSRMTQVPAALASDNLAATAKQWIGTANTPVAQATNLLTYMQRFKLDPLATPPKGADGIGWFLQHQRGNVLLWASTYIMLGRAIGLPLRLAEGYLPGTYSTSLHAQVVQASDATVWVQLAIPGQGWLDLFPAANVQTITVPGTIIYATPPAQPTVGATPTPASNQKPGQRNPATGTTGAQATGTLVTIALLILTVLVLIGAALAVISWRWAQFGQKLAPLMRFFARVGRLAQLGGVPLRSSDTASQATDKVVAYLPQQEAALHTLNRAYERVIYGPPAAQALLLNLREQWDALRRDLWRLVVSRFTRWRGKQ